VDDIRWISLYRRQYTSFSILISTVSPNKRQRLTAQLKESNPALHSTAHGPTLIFTFLACISANSASEISELVDDVRCLTDRRSSPGCPALPAAASWTMSSSAMAADSAASAAHAVRAPRRSGAHWLRTMSAKPAFTSSQLTRRSVPGKMSSTFWMELVYDCTLS
jgi:hypothetical protein